MLTLLLPRDKFIAPSGYSLGAGLICTGSLLVALVQQVLCQNVILLVTVVAWRLMVVVLPFWTFATVADFTDHLHLVFHFRVRECGHDLSGHLAWLLS